MTEYTTKGTIITLPYKSCDLTAGSVCIVLLDDVYYRITLLHMNKDGDWLVEGDYKGVVDEYDTLLKLSFMDGENVIPIAMKYWTKILKRSMLYDKQFHNFLIKPHKFKEGKKYQTCTDCMASFKAAPSQPLCKSCCVVKSIAHLDTSASVKPGPVINLPQVMQLTRIAYEMGREEKSEEEFIKWLENKDLWQ